MSERVETRIPLKEPGKYKKVWGETQDEQDYYDSKKACSIYPQFVDYIEDNNALSGGVCSFIDEEKPQMDTSAALKRDLSFLKEWLKKETFGKVLIRPLKRSTFDEGWYEWRMKLRIALGYLFIRELPIKNFHARSFIMYFYIFFFLGRTLGRGLFENQTFYNHDHFFRHLLNYPDLFHWTTGRAPCRHPPEWDETMEWRMMQKPVFYEYHAMNLRYKLRKARYIPWDGTMNQPVMPFLKDTGTSVIHGGMKTDIGHDPRFN